MTFLLDVGHNLELNPIIYFFPYIPQSSSTNSIAQCASHHTWLFTTEPTESPVEPRGAAVHRWLPTPSSRQQRSLACVGLRVERTREFDSKSVSVGLANEQPSAVWRRRWELGQGR